MGYSVAGWWDYSIWRIPPNVAAMLKTSTQILITGATSGFGEAMARLFAKEWQAPLTLVLTGRRGDRLEKLKNELSHGQVQVVTGAFDIRDHKAVEGFASSAEVQKTDVLINNAGMASGRGPLQSGEVSDWEAMIDTNVKGLLYISRALLPHMITRRRGHIVNLSSIAGHTVYPNGNVYCATKFAVQALGEAMRIDTLGKNIRVTNISPGKAETEFSVVRYKGDQAAAHAEYEGYTPLSADDIAESVLWSLSRPAHVNIQEIVILPTEQASARDLYRK